MAGRKSLSSLSHVVCGPQDYSCSRIVHMSIIICCVDFCDCCMLFCNGGVDFKCFFLQYVCRFHCEMLVNVDIVKLVHKLVIKLKLKFVS